MPQIIYVYNQIFQGTKTRLIISFGQCHYGKSRSREVLTTTNHMGVSCSYNDVMRSRKLLVAYTVSKSDKDGVPIPSNYYQKCMHVWSYG